MEFTAKLLALRDIRNRPADQIRGSKRMWRMALIVNFFGPAGYFLFGRRRPEAA
ncbi:MAG: PLDc N-terminal domain-containing protein [Thermoleophilaceae bacterium]|nr:PLDc N-terminal domain-containing protein [Thermoleophilaceae bacterium]